MPPTTMSATDLIVVDRLRHLELLKEKLRRQQGLPHLPDCGWPLYQWAKEYWESRKKIQLICAANQISKAQPHDTLIPTPDGPRQLGELRPGDRVFGADGMPCEVLSIPFDGEDECFLLTFDDGSTAVASGEHEWIAKTYRERFRRKYTTNWEGPSNGQVNPNPHYGTWVQLSTKELMVRGKYSPTTSAPLRCAIPIAQPVQRPAINLFDPYLVGLVLGDGGVTGRAVVMTTADAEIAEYLARYGAVPSGRFGYRLNGLQPIFRELEVMGHGSAGKFIPHQYFLGSVEQRLALLQGLMDTDGTIRADGVMSFTSVSSYLANGVRELVASLGGKSKMKMRASYYVKNGQRIPCRMAYTLHIKMLLCPFRLTRKAQQFRRTRYAHERVIYSIQPVGRKRCRCLTVSSVDGSYLTTADYLVTHNSSTQIRKHIHWATEPSLWPKLWRNCPPRQFWYCYPSRDVAHVEWTKKWIPEFMPRGEFKDHPQYGYRQEIYHSRIFAIHWNSGVSTYFKTYAQDAQDLQTGTVWKLDLDEECPEELMSELMMRLAATDGYLSAVFTPTLGQEYWRQAIEEKGTKQERFPDGFKIQVSMFDCLKYADGRPSPWSKEQINRAINSCKSQNEVDRRVFGKFVVAENLKYPSFNRTRNRKPGHFLPKNWSVWAGVDIGSGGDENHPSAIVLVGVSPDWKEGRVFKGWRGDGVITEASDVVRKLIEMTAGMENVQMFYDWACRDFFTIAQNMGLPVMPAEKSHAIGEQVLNVLFKNQMLWIYDYPELDPLCVELSTLKNSTPKGRAKDDFADALRYACAKVPWAWDSIRSDVIVKLEERQRPVPGSGADRREFWTGDDGLRTAEDEIAEWNELLGQE